MKTRSALLSVILIATSICVAHAQKESEIVAKLRTALLRYANEGEAPIIIKGKFSMGPIAMDGAMYYDKPRNRMELSTMGMTFITVRNDSLNWTYNPVDNTHKIERLSKEKVDSETKRELLFDFASKDLLNYKSRGHKLKSLGIKKTDSVETYALQMTTADKEVVDFFISTKTNLIYKIQAGEDFRIYSNYQMKDNYAFPAFMAMIYNGQLMQMVLTDIKMNASIPLSTFAVPQEAFDSQKKRESKLEDMIAHADSLYQNKEYDKASTEYTSILSKYGRVFRAYNGRGLCNIATEKYYDAVSDFNRALEIVPTASNGLNNRGLAKYYIGDNKGALQDYAAAIASDSTQVSAYTNRGLIYLGEEKYNEAITEYGHAIRLRPNHADSRYRYGIALAQVDRYPEAIKAYHTAISMGLVSGDIHNYTGVAYYKLENYDSAAMSFKSALGFNKDNLQFIENYGNSLYAMANYTDAAKQFEHYLSMKNDNAEIHNMIGLCKYQQEDYKGAIQKFSKSIELTPKNATYYDNRASAKELIQDYEGAIADYSQSITLYPNDADTFYKRGLLKIQTSRKLEGCMDLGTANEMKHEGAKEAILKNCN